jgi:hypothetical protein
MRRMLLRPICCHTVVPSHWIRGGHRPVSRTSPTISSSLKADLSGSIAFWLRWRGGEKEREAEIGLKVTGHSAEQGKETGALASGGRRGARAIPCLC